MTTEIEPLIHADAQFQNPEPIGPQDEMPFGDHDIEISWDRRAGWMRAIISEQGWHFKELLGHAVIVGTDSDRGRMNVRAAAVILGPQLTLFRPDDADRHPWVKGVAYASAFQRLCYRRAERDWRLRDEDKTRAGDLSAIRFVQGYVGDWDIEWDMNDPIAHLYHRGPWTLCDPGCYLHKDGGYAHLYED